MKKRAVILLVCCAVLAGCMLPVFGSGGNDNALVTKSYLERTFFGQLVETVSGWVADARESLLDQEEEKLDGLGRDYLEQLGQDTVPAGMQVTETFTDGGGERYDTVSLFAGSGLVWHSGTGTVSGKLIDLTDGAEVTASGLLTEGHRYLAAQDTVITVCSLTARWAVEGVWSTTSDGISIKDIPFTDVAATSWYYENVVYVYNRDLFNGTSSTTFSPLYTMDRNMLTTVLYRMAGEPAAAGPASCADIEAGRWYTDGAVWAVSCGIVNGMVDDGLFHPSQKLQREEIALMLYQYAAWLGRDTSARTDLSAFSDSDSISDTAREAISWAAALRLFRGYDGKLGPADNVERAQVAALLQRFEEWLG